MAPAQTTLMSMLRPQYGTVKVAVRSRGQSPLRLAIKRRTAVPWPVVVLSPM